MNIFEELEEDHRVQRALLERLIRTMGDLADRNYFLAKLKRELFIHAKAEEQFFYNYLLEFDSIHEKVKYSIVVHSEINELMEQLEEADKMGYGPTVWLITAKKLKKRIERHIDKEEQKLFPLAKNKLTSKRMLELAIKYKKFVEDHRRI